LKKETTVREEQFSHEHITVIEPLKGSRTLDQKELWGYRELIFVLTQRDTRARHKLMNTETGW
jgi:hypothetical protein